MESKFQMDNVFYTATGEYLSFDLKDAVKECSEHEILRHSAEFLEKYNPIIEAFKNRKLPLLPYMVLLKDANELRKSLPYDVVTMRTFSTEIEDDLGIMRKVTFQGTIETEELPAPSLLEAYRTSCQETLGRDELTDLTVRRHVAVRQNQTNLPPPRYSNQDEYETWLKSINLRNDSKAVNEFVDALTETARKYKFLTDEGQNLQIDVLNDLPDIKTEWEKKAADPSTFPGEQTADTRLLLELQDLAKEAYEFAQRRAPKSGGSFFEQLKGLFKRNEAALLFPEDAKEGA